MLRRTWLVMILIIAAVARLWQLNVECFSFLFPILDRPH
jgi:hypothetical protein